MLLILTVPNLPQDRGETHRFSTRAFPSQRSEVRGQSRQGEQAGRGWRRICNSCKLNYLEAHWVGYYDLCSIKS